MPKISAVILTYNEEKNIERCLLSIKDLTDDIVIVDSFSTDSTKKICENFNLRFIEHEFIGYIEQKNWAITKAKHPYILSLDADEALSDELIKSIQQVKENWEYDGYSFNRLTNYCGKWIKHTSWYPSRKLRLWDSRKGKWGGINPHDEFNLFRGYKQKHLKGDILHYSYYSITEHINQMNRFSGIVARAYFNRGTKSNYFKIIFHPLWRMFRDYFLKAGFLDGFYGLVISINSAHETFLKYVKLRQLCKDAAKQMLNSICFINSNKSWGGGEKWHYDIITRFTEKGYNTLMISNKYSELLNRLQTTNIRSYNVRVSNLSFLNPFKVFRLVRIYKEKDVKTVIINLSADLKVAGIAAKIAGVRNIIYRRGSAIPIRNTILNRYLYNNIVTGIIANSKETRRTILSNNLNLISENKIKVIYNGIDFKEYEKLKCEPLYTRQDGEIILGNAGRLSEEKGQFYLLQLARILKSKGLRFKILIAGTGKLEKKLKHQAEIMGIKDEIKFLGFVNNIKSFMRTIDIFLLTSVWEGFGYVLVEAMAEKKPVVAFDIRSSAEIVNTGDSGFIVEQGNVKELSLKVEQLINDDNLRNQMGAKGEASVKEKFRIENTLKEVELMI